MRKGARVEEGGFRRIGHTALISFPEGNLVEKVHGNQSIRYFCKERFIDIAMKIELIVKPIEFFCKGLQFHMVGMSKGERRLGRNGDGHIRCVIVLIRFPRCGLSGRGSCRGSSAY